MKKSKKLKWFFVTFFNELNFSGNAVDVNFQKKMKQGKDEMLINAGAWIFLTFYFSLVVNESTEKMISNLLFENGQNYQSSNSTDDESIASGSTSERSEPMEVVADKALVEKSSGKKVFKKNFLS